MKWTEENLERAILDIANQFDPPRMPSKSEADEMYGSYALSCAISKNGGFNYWAEKLGLEQKQSETSIGIAGEQTILLVLKQLGHEVETTPTKYPYDLLVDGRIKVDVKTANTSYIRGCPIHAYRLAKKQPTCDFYIFLEADTGRSYVVPANRCSGQVQVEMGMDSKEYAPYRNAYDKILMASKFYELV